MSRPGSRRAGVAIGLLSITAWLAGCASTPAPTWHSLVPAAAAVAPAAPASGPGRAALTLAIGAVSLPDEVDRAQLVLRSGGALAVLDGERWAEPLKAQLPRAIALAVGQRLPGAVVVAEPNRALALPAWRVGIDVQRFELQRAPDQALLRVVWALRPGAGREGAPPPAMPAQVFEVAVPAQGGHPAALVAAMAAAVAQLSGQISQSLCPAGGC